MIHHFNNVNSRTYGIEIRSHLQTYYTSADDYYRLGNFFKVKNFSVG